MAKGSSSSRSASGGEGAETLLFANAVGSTREDDDAAVIWAPCCGEETRRADPGFGDGEGADAEEDEEGRLPSVASDGLGIAPPPAGAKKAVSEGRFLGLLSGMEGDGDGGGATKDIASDVVVVYYM